jgi:GNAT superfamily N-acetyltransferase
MPEVCRVSEADYAELSAFLAAFPDDESGSAKSWLRRMHCWWDLNPAFDDAFSRGWVLREHGAIVGFLGAIPWRFQLGGRETTVFGGTTWRVLPEYRGLSIALKRRQMKEHGDVLHLSTTPAADVERLLRRLGYAPMRDTADVEFHSDIVLNFEKVLRAKLNGRPSAGIVAKQAAKPLSVIQSLRTRGLHRCAHQNVRKLERADERFDDLWERTKDRFPSTHVRTAEAVNWYCFGSPEFEKTLFGYFEGERLAGWIVFLSTERRGMRFFECVDLWTEPGSRRDEIIGALVEKARRYAERRSFDRLYLPHFDGRTEAIYRRLGLLRISGPPRPGLYLGPRELMRKLKPADSYLVLGEGDYGL